MNSRDDEIGGGEGGGLYGHRRSPKIAEEF